jgi:FO synthase
MHAVARLALNPVISNIQTSWVKMGVEGAAFSLRAGANDLGGTLMNESITRAAGGVNGQELGPDRIAAVADTIGRPVRQRTTFYEIAYPGATVGGND